MTSPSRGRKADRSAVATTRPASGLSWDSPPHPTYNYWGTGNVEEVLPGITRPLPADIVTAYMHIYARGLLEIAGVLDLVDLADLPQPNIFGFFGGRWAVNIAWMGPYVATYQPDQQSDMLTQFVRGDSEATRSGVAANAARARRTRRTVERTWVRSVPRAAREATLAARYRRAAFRARLTRQSDQALMDRVDKTIELAGRIFIRHAQSSMGGGEGIGLLNALLDSEIPGHPAEWTTTLTSALQGVVSGEPIRGIWTLSRIASRLPSVAADFRADDITVLKGKLASPPNDQWRRYRDAHAAFIDEFGFRGQREVDPSVADWGEDPAFVLAAVRADLGLTSAKDPSKREARAAAARERLERKVEARLPEARRAEFRKLLAETQVYVKARELTKSNWAQVCRAFRPPLLELARRFAERDLLECAEDIWFLRLEELRAAVAGNLKREAARTAVSARRAEFEELSNYALPVVFSLPVDLEPIVHSAPSSGVTLTGMGVSPGVATGPARIIMSAEAGDAASIEPGEVLVAPFTDAPWTPLFWPAVAVVVERGGMLSHASTVAREFGIPAVVSVPHATELIRTGAIVTVDGNTGTVTVA